MAIIYNKDSQIQDTQGCVTVNFKMNNEVLADLTDIGANDLGVVCTTLGAYVGVVNYPKGFTLLLDGFNTDEFSLSLLNKKTGELYENSGFTTDVTLTVADLTEAVGLFDTEAL